jgi:hypothetical protein
MYHEYMMAKAPL